MGKCENTLSKKMSGAFNHYLTDLERLGYTNSYQVLDSRDFGIPQARERLFTVSILDGEWFNFSLLERKPMRAIKEFLEEKVDSKYLVTQPSMVSKLPGKIVSGTYGGRMLTEVKDYVWTITTKQMRSPNSGVVRVDDDVFRYLTERECWRLMGFDDDDYERALKEHPGKENKLNGTLYHQAGNSIVVDVLESIFKSIIDNHLIL